MDKGAIFSECGTYRYQLWRTWDETLQKVLFIMLNPSKADAQQNDPTITRCIGFAKGWGYGGIVVGNLFAYRSTKPKNMFEAFDAIGPDNLTHLMAMMEQCDKIILAWGNPHIVRRLIKKQNCFTLFEDLEGPFYVLDVCSDGTPRHPLFLKSTLEPFKIDLTFENEKL